MRSRYPERLTQLPITQNHCARCPMRNDSHTQFRMSHKHAWATVVQMVSLTSRPIRNYPYASPKYMTFALAYRAFPCGVFPFTVTKPVIFNAFRADLTASILFLDTTFPYLFLIRPSFFRPPDVSH